MTHLALPSHASVTSFAGRYEDKKLLGKVAFTSGFGFRAYELYPDPPTQGDRTYERATLQGPGKP